MQVWGQKRGKVNWTSSTQTLTTNRLTRDQNCVVSEWWATKGTTERVKPELCNWSEGQTSISGISRGEKRKFILK